MFKHFVLHGGLQSPFVAVRSMQQRLPASAVRRVRLCGDDFPGVLWYVECCAPLIVCFCRSSYEA